jgi:hypothetical protein
VVQHGWRILVITRLVPLLPFNLQNFAYGLTGIRFSTYILVATAPAASEEIRLLADLSTSAAAEALPPGWQPLVFRKIPSKTRYAIVPDGGSHVLKAESQAAASGLLRPLDADPRTYRILSWRWKVENVLAKGDERTKEGDDYAARVYVAFQYDPASASAWERARYGAYKLLYGEYPPKAVLNYIWANRLPKGEALVNAFTDRAIMIAVESGPELVGRWLTAERDIYADYTRVFGGEPPHISGIAIMTDTDNTGERAVAYYDDLRLRAIR